MRTREAIDLMATALGLQILMVPRAKWTLSFLMGTHTQSDPFYQRDDLDVMTELKIFRYTNVTLMNVSEMVAREPNGPRA